MGELYDSIRAVIVDDDFLVRSYLKQLGAWEKAGYEIVADARDGEEALKAVEEHCPDVVVTDLSMPLMDGIELIRQIRAENSFVYIIVLSCHDDFEYVKKAMKLGADEYVLKNSLDEESLFEMLENTKFQMEGRKKKFQESDEARRLMELGRHTRKYHYFNGLLARSFSPEEQERRRIEAGIKAAYGNSAVINMFIPEWGILKGRFTELELEQYTGFLRIGQLPDFCEGYRRELFLSKKKIIPSGCGPAIRVVVDYLHEHYKEQIGLTEAAQSAGLNPAYLSYLFKQELGTGFSNYLLELRMDCARGLLKNTNLKVKDVAAQSGFNDYHYFSKAFKKLHEVSPADYRKQNQGT